MAKCPVMQISKGVSYYKTRFTAVSGTHTVSGFPASAKNFVLFPVVTSQTSGYGSMGMNSGTHAVFAYLADVGIAVSGTRDVGSGEALRVVSTQSLASCPESLENGVFTYCSGSYDRISPNCQYEIIAW